MWTRGRGKKSEYLVDLLCGSHLNARSVGMRVWSGGAPSLSPNRALLCFPSFPDSCQKILWAAASPPRREFLLPPSSSADGGDDDF